jgi:hypothetical protein
MDPISTLRHYCHKFGGDLVKVTKPEFKRLQEVHPFKGLVHTYLNAPVQDGEYFAHLEKLNVFYLSPFAPNLGIHWPSRTVVYADDSVRWPHIVHEMGHVFAQEQPPDGIFVDELNFLGWEYRMAQKVGDLKEWLDANDDYQIGDYQPELGDATLGGLSKSELSAVLKKVLARGRNFNLTAKLEPISVRKTCELEDLHEFVLQKVRLIEQVVEAKTDARIFTGEQLENQAFNRGYRAGYSHGIGLLVRYLHSMRTHEFSIPSRDKKKKS